jgi:hypothetical protein
MSFFLTILLPLAIDSYPYERKYLIVVNEDGFVLVGANDGDLSPTSVYGGATVSCDDFSGIILTGNNAKILGSSRQLAVGPSPRTPSLDGSSVFQSGLVFDPNEIKSRNKPDGVT